MEIKELQDIIQQNGVVGAGGAGFPTYMKLTDKANTILMNCAECEPLLKLHRQLLEKHAYEIMKTFHMIQETVGASEAIIGIKKSYVQTIHALNQHIEEFPGMRLHLLDCWMKYIRQVMRLFLFMRQPDVWYGPEDCRSSRE